MLVPPEALAEELHLRAHSFWLQRSLPLLWPVDFKGFTFLGKVVDQVGNRVFRDWNGSEPAELHMPTLTGAPQSEVSESVRYFAALVLLSLDPSAPKNLLDTLQTRQQLGELPFTDDQWARANSLFREQLDARQKLAGFKMSHVMRIIVEAASEERILMATRSITGQVTMTDPSAWRSELAYARFGEFQMNPATPFIKSFPQTMAGVALFKFRFSPELLPGNEWIFVENNSLEKLLTSLSVETKNLTIGKTEPVRQRALIRQEIKALLEDAIRQWREGGESSDLRVGKEQFAKLAVEKIPDAKPTWGIDIWLKNRPEEWAKPGRR